MPNLRRRPLVFVALAALALAACQAPAPVVPTAITGPGATPTGPGVAANPVSPTTTAAPTPKGAGRKGQQIPPGPDAVIRNLAALGPAGKPGKMLLAIYMIGSDLEDDGKDQPDAKLNKYGAATSDFQEILAAVKGLSAEERKNLDVLALFGGARQLGWKGTKLVDLEGLVKDAEDGYFGNADPSTYLKDMPGADMGDAANFESFLSEVEKRRTGASKVFLEFWDHGSSFAGVGPDTNSKRRLKCDEIKRILDKQDFHADIIGFDACLMASVEVVQSVRGHADYLIASEETEPGHGWDYSLWLSQVAKKPEATSPEIGTMLVDTFLDSPSHKATNGRTLSLINLEKAGTLLTATDQMGEALAGSLGRSSTLDGVLDASRGCQKYGSRGASGDELSRDLRTFASLLAKEDPGIATLADAVNAAVANCILYSREDGSKPGSKGISIYSLENAAWFTSGKYSEKTASGPGWFNLVKSVNAGNKADAVAPKISELTAGVAKALNFGLAQLNEGGAAAATIADAGEDGFDIAVDDEVGVRSVEGVHVLRINAVSKISEIVATEAATQVSENRFHVPAWDGFALYLTGSEGTKVQVPFTVETSEGGLYIWVINGQWNGRDATLRVVVDGLGNVLTTWVVPYDEAEDGTVVIQREQFELGEGDKIAFWHDIVDVEKLETRLELGQAVSVGGGAAFSWEKVPGQAYYFAIARDLRGNTSNSEGHVVQ